MPTLNDLIRVNDMNLADAEFSNVFNKARLVEALEAVEASNGTQHKYLVETGAPTVGFRQPNQGRANADGTEVTVSTDLKIMDASFDIDKALADKYKDGPEAYIRRHASRYLRAGLFRAEGAIINGDVANDGFAGLAQAVTDSVNSEAYLDNGSVDAGAESVYLLNSAEEGFALVTDEVLEIGESYITRATDNNGDPYDVYRTPMISWMTIQAGGKFDIVRIANVGPDKPLDDDLLYAANALMPADKSASLILCSRTTQEQVRKSRVATSNTGAPAPTPDTIPGLGRLIVSNVKPD
jgi:hypothetical protein